MTSTMTMTFATQRWTGRQWKEVCRFNWNPIDKLAWLPNPHTRRVIDLTTGAVWAWNTLTRDYRETAAKVEVRT